MRLGQQPLDLTFGQGSATKLNPFKQPPGLNPPRIDNQKGGPGDELATFKAQFSGDVNKPAAPTSLGVGQRLDLSI